MQKTLISVHGYEGDSHQIRGLMPMFEHHNMPVVIVSPDDSQIHGMGPHICRTAGKRAYIGQDSWNRQWLQMKLLLEYKDFDWFLINDSDSFVLEPILPDYLYESDNVLWSNMVDDFRRPGETWTDSSGSITWPKDYHQGFPLNAAQPPYFCHRNALQKMVQFGPGVACPTTPFIDWQMIVLPTLAGVKLKPFLTGASCETVTANGIAVMTECIVKRGATFIHSVKSKEVMERLLSAHRNK